MSHAKKKKIAIIVLASTAALLAAGTVSGVLYAHQSATKRSKNNDKKPEIQDISELEKKIDAIRDSHKQNLKNEAWKILEALKITIRNAKKANNVRDLSQVISDFERLIPLGEGYLAELKKLPEVKTLASELETTINLAKEALDEAKAKLKELQEKEAKLKENAQKLLAEINQALSEVPDAKLPLVIQSLINKLKNLANASEALQQELNNSRLIEEAKKLSDANLQIKDAISELQKRLLDKSPEELEKLAKEKIKDLEKAKKAVEDAKNISTLPNALESLKKDLDQAKELKDHATAKGLDELAKELDKAIKDAENSLKHGTEKLEKIKQENQKLQNDINALVNKIAKDISDANKLTLQSEDSEFKRLKDELKKDIQEATKLAKQAADATLLADEQKVLDAKKQAETSLDKLNDLFSQKKEQELAKTELEKAYSALAKATEEANKADDENTLPLAISQLEDAIAKAELALGKHENLKEKELIKSIYDALKAYKEKEADEALANVKKRFEAKKQAKAKIDADLDAKQNEFNAIKNTIESSNTINDIPTLQNAIKQLEELKPKVKAIEESAKNASYPEGEQKAKKLLEEISKLDLETKAKLEKLQEEKETQEQEKKLIESLREKITKITKNLETLDSRGKSQLSEATPKQTELAKTLKELEEQLKNAQDVQKEVQDAHKENALETELEKLEEAKNKATTTKQSLETKISDSNKNIKERLDNAKSELEELKKKINDAYNDRNLEELTKELNKLEELKEKVESLETLATAVESKHKQEVTNLLSEVRDAILDAKKKHAELDKALKDENILVDELEKKLKEHENNLAKAKDEANDANTIDEKKDKYPKLDKTIKDIEKNLKKLEEKAKDLKDKTNKDSIDSKIKDLTKKLDEAKTDLANKNQTLKEEQENNDTSTQQSLKGADEAIKKADDAIKNLSDKTKTNEAEDALKNAKNDLENKKNSLVGDKENQDKIDKKLEEIVNKQKELQKEKAKQQSEDDLAKQLANEAKTLKDELDDLVNKLNPYDASSDYEKKIKDVEDKIKNLDENFFKVDSDATKLKDNSNLKPNYQALKAAKEDADRKTKDACQKIKASKEKLEVDYKQYENEVKQLQEELKNAVADADFQAILNKIGEEGNKTKLLGKVKELHAQSSKFSDKEELSKKIKTLETNLLDIKEEANNKLQSIQDKITKLNKDLETTNTTLNAQNSTTNNVASDDVDSLKAEIKKLQDQLNEANKLKEKAQKETDQKIKDGIKKKLETLEQSINAATTTITNKQQQLNSQKTTNDTDRENAIKKSTDAKQKLADANNLADNDVNKIGKLEEALEDANKAKETLEQTIQKLAKDNENQKLVETELKDLEKQIKSSQDKLDFLKEGDKKKLENIEKELEKIKKSLTDADNDFNNKTDLKAKEEANNELGNVLTKAKGDLAAQKTEISKLQDGTNKNSANEKVSQLEKLINDLKEKHKKNAQDIAKTKQENADLIKQPLKEANDALKKANDAIAKDNSDGKKEQSLVEAEQNLNTQKDVLEGLINGKLKDDSENKTKLADKLKEIREKLTDLDAAKKELNKTQQDKIDELDNQLQNQNNALSTQNDVTSGVNDSYVDSLKTEIKKLEDLVKEAKKLQQKVDAETDPKIKEGIKDKLKILTDTIKESEDTINSKNQALEAQKTINDKIRQDAITKSVEAKAKITNAKNLADSDTSKLSKLEEALNDANKAKKALEDETKQLVNDKENKALVEAELRALKEQIIDTENAIKILKEGDKDKFESIKQELEKIQQSLNDANNDFKNKTDLKVKEEANNKLKDAIDKAEADLASQKNEIGKLKDQTNKTSASTKIEEVEKLIKRLKDEQKANAQTINTEKTKNEGLVKKPLEDSQKALDKANEAIQKSNDDNQKENALTDAESELKKQKKNLDDLIKGELKNDSENKKKLEDKIKDIDKKLQEVDQVKQELKQSQDEKSKELAIRARELKQELDAWINKLDAANKKWSQSSKDIANVQKAIDKIEEFLQANKNLKNNLNLKTDYEALMKSKDVGNKALQNAKELIENKKVEFEEKIKTLEEKTRDLETNLLSNNTTDGLNSIIREIGNESIGLLKKINQIQSEIAKFEDTGDELLIKLSALKEKTNNLLLRAKEKIQELDNKIIKEIETEINNIKYYLKNSYDTFIGSDSTYDQKKKEFAEFENKIIESKEKLVALRNKSSTIQDQTNKQKVEEKIDDLDRYIKDPCEAQWLVEAKNKLKEMKEKNDQIANEAIAKADQAIEQAKRALKKDDDDSTKEQDLENALVLLEKAKQSLEDVKTKLSGDSENLAKIIDKIVSVEQIEKLKEAWKLAKEANIHLESIKKVLKEIKENNSDVEFLKLKKRDFLTKIDDARNFINKEDVKKLEEIGELRSYLKNLKDIFAKAERSDEIISNTLNHYEELKNVYVLGAAISLLENVFKDFFSQINDDNINNLETSISNILNTFSLLINEPRSKVLEAKEFVNNPENNNEYISSKKILEQTLNIGLQKINDINNLINSSLKKVIEILDANLKNVEAKINGANDKTKSIKDFINQDFFKKGDLEEFAKQINKFFFNYRYAQKFVDGLEKTWIWEKEINSETKSLLKNTISAHEDSQKQIEQIRNDFLTKTIVEIIQNDLHSDKWKNLDERQKQKLIDEQLDISTEFRNFNDQQKDQRQRAFEKLRKWAWGLSEKLKPEYEEEEKILNQLNKISQYFYFQYIK
ncbi:MspA/MspB/MIB-like signal-anchor domain-contatining protein [Metamycoplasma arthritidis]|uniref:Massive surface protein MspC n=1 Tax=Metamycoplasma arthritidis (strain 158L3-1) TaxID=243272 RepID=B3PMQ9_META1|nr:massive surface protein MspC [Metamycoplasma arthritidis]ACF07311.1 massive surface protein MspC [Metamycoplasma arthritidis 158L3-1]